MPRDRLALQITRIFPLAATIERMRDLFREHRRATDQAARAFTCA